MTTDTGTKGTAFDKIDEEFLDEKAFSRTELKTINRIKIVETAPAPEDWLRVRQVPYNTEAFKQAYPQGLPCLHVALEGVDVSYDFDADKLKHIWIPLYGERPEKFGDRKGNRSHADIMTRAIVSTFKVRPYGRDNQALLVGRVAQWGQYLGEFTLEGAQDPTEYAWDVPRNALPDNFKFSGEVKVIKGRSSNTGTGGVGTQELDIQEQADRIVAALVGLGGDQATEASDRIMNIAGLASEWYDAAAQGKALGLAAERKLIKAVNGKAVKA